MKVLTWNINSVRLRANHVANMMADLAPDIVCLQETKTPDEHFPLHIFEEDGYKYHHIHGMKGYNGVAILSKMPFHDSDIHHRVGREDCRHIAAKFKGFDVHVLYVPAGGDEPNPDTNEKFKHKLDFVKEMTDWFASHYTPKDPVITLGDFNIAPYEHDVWSHKQLLKVVSHTPAETERLTKMRESLDWVDTARHFIPMEEKAYTWWSYRNRDWKKSNRGRRLDHIWVTQPLKPVLQKYETFPEMRNLEKPSDHIPVMVTLDLPQ